MAPFSWSGSPKQFIDGVPRRDLTAEEVAALDPIKRHDALASGLYVELTESDGSAGEDESDDTPEGEEHQAEDDESW